MGVDVTALIGEVREKLGGSNRKKPAEVTKIVCKAFELQDKEWSSLRD